MKIEELDWQTLQQYTLREAQALDMAIEIMTYSEIKPEAKESKPGSLKETYIEMQCSILGMKIATLFGKNTGWAQAIGDKIADIYMDEKKDRSDKAQALVLLVKGRYTDCLSDEMRELDLRKSKMEKCMAQMCANV